MKRVVLTLVMGCVIVLVAACSSSKPRSFAELEGERFLTKGVSAWRNDDLLTAATFFTKALAHYQGLDDHKGQLESRINLVEVSLAVSNTQAAETHLTQAERLAVDELASYQPRLLLLRSSLAMAQGSREEARRQSERLLPQKLGGSGEVQSDDAIVREALINRATLAFDLAGDDPALWLERLKSHGKGDNGSAARLERLRARLAYQQGDVAAATASLQQALELCKEPPSRGCIAATLEQWGALLQHGNDLAPARDRYQRALAVRMALLDRTAAGADLRQLAAISQAAGESERNAILVRWAEFMNGSEAVDWNRLRREALPK